MASNIRQRKTFGFSEDGDGPADETRVLDEQEQEEIIQDLREAARHSNAQLTRTIAAILGAGIALQLYFLSSILRGSESTPLTPVLDLALEPKPLIPLAFVFTLVHICIHALDIASFYAPHLQQSIPEDVSRYAPVVTCVAPFVALLSGRDVAQLAWWAVPAELSALVWVSRGWMAGAVEDVASLETLRYDAKGA